jgi:hypothetical protein
VRSLWLTCRVLSNRIASEGQVLFQYAMEVPAIRLMSRPDCSFRDEAYHSRMSLIAIVPEKHASTPTKLKTFFRVILAILASMGAIDEEKRRLTCLVKIPTRSVCEMLFDTSCTEMPLKLPADNSTGNTINVLLRKILLGIALHREGLR